jgi:DeoR/GlpR family transcriptional regulator of sugar metabolism
MPRGEKEKRQQTILMRLLRDGRVNTHDLSTEFGITDVAIRGDFDDIGVLLKSRGLFMNRFYGGAELIQPGQHYRGFYEGHSEIEVEAIQLLSEYVVRHFVHWDDSLLLDTGRTVDRVAQHIITQEKSGLRIITNSYTPHILELYTQGEIELVQLGGVPLPRAFCFVKCPGGDAFYQPYWTGPFKVILTGSAFDLDEGLMVNNPDIIEVKQHFIKAASEVFLILDHSKFNKTARETVTFCGMRSDPWLTAGRPLEDEKDPFIPLTIITDIPSGQHAEDLPLSSKMSPQADGRVCLYKSRIPLSVSTEPQTMSS